MDLRFTSEEEAFRNEVRAFLDEILPQRLSPFAKQLIMPGHQPGDEDHHLSRFCARGRAA